MFTDLTKIGPKSLVKGAKYKLKKSYTNNSKTFRFDPPHEFKYLGRDGMGNYQDEERFIDDNGHKLNFCVSLDTWSDYLERIE